MRNFILMFLFGVMTYGQTDDTIMIFAQNELDADNWNNHESFFVNLGSGIRTPYRPSGDIILAATIYVQTDPGILRLGRSEARIVSENECLDPTQAPLVEYSVIGELNDIFPEPGGFQYSFYTNNELRLRLHSDDSSFPREYRDIWDPNCYH